MMHDPAWSNASRAPSCRSEHAGLVGDVWSVTVTGFFERPPTSWRSNVGSPTEALFGTAKSTTWASCGTSITCCTGLARATALRLLDSVALITHVPACRNVAVDPSIVQAWWVVDESTENVIVFPEPPEAFSS